MALNMTAELWQAICAAAATYPTCTIHLRQHEGWIRGFTVEHGPVLAQEYSAPPSHIQPSFVAAAASAKKRH